MSTPRMKSLYAYAHDHCEQAKAREKLWTPEKSERQGGTGQLWTPGT